MLINVYYNCVVCTFVCTKEKIKQMFGNKKKPLGIKNYGSIPHLSNSNKGKKDFYLHPGQEKILTEKTRDRHDNIFVFEKYDGSNVGIAKKRGNIFALIRSGYEASTSPYIQHKLFAKWVGRRFDYFSELLYEGERIVGEWLLQAHGTKYNIVSEPIVFFDWFDNENNRKPIMDWWYVESLPKARLLHSGGAISVEKIKTELFKSTPGIVPENKPEGMVYRCERKGKVDFLAKWVRPDFEPGIFCIGKQEEELIWNK